MLMSTVVRTSMSGGSPRVGYDRFESLAAGLWHPIPARAPARSASSSQSAGAGGPGTGLSGMVARGSNCSHGLVVARVVPGAVCTVVGANLGATGFVESVTCCPSPTASGWRFLYLCRSSFRHFATTLDVLIELAALEQNSSTETNDGNLIPQNGVDPADAAVEIFRRFLDRQ